MDRTNTPWQAIRGEDSMTTTDRGELRRLPERGTREWETIREILDAGTIASVGFSVEGQPFVIPMLYGRNDQNLILHGS